MTPDRAGEEMKDVPSSYIIFTMRKHNDSMQRDVFALNHFFCEMKTGLAA
jgi:hypothetical protein